MMTTNKPIAAERFALPDTNLAPIFAGWQSGAYDLPDALTGGAAACLELVARSFTAEQERARTLPDRRGSLAARQAFDVADDAAHQARAARDHALHNLEGMVAGLGDELVVNYLRPAHDAALAAVREALPALDGADLSDTASVASAGPAAGPAFLAIVNAWQRLSAVDAARECVFHHQRLLGGEWRDPFEGSRHDGVLRDTPLWPAPIIATISRAARVTIGPPHPLVRVAWLAGDGAGWCPTWREWQAAFEAWYTSPERNGRPARKVPTIPAPTIRD
jgi:hypothetical protein